MSAPTTSRLRVYVRLRDRPGVRLRVRLHGERGSAAVEFVFLAALLIVPLFYIVGTLGRVQSGSYAATMAAREAGRAYVTADTAGEAGVRARAAARLAFEDQGFGDRETTLRLGCDSARCLRPGGTVRVDTVVRVPLPLMPAFAEGDLPPAVVLRATHVVSVDRYRSVG